MRVLNIKEVARKTGLSRVTIWRLGRKNDFPKQISLSQNRRGFIESEVDEWILSRYRGGESCQGGENRGLSSKFSKFFTN